jgi:hypothetical protein
MPFPIKTEGALKPESTSSEVADAITSSWSKGLSDFAAGATMSKAEADKFAQALNHYAGSYVTGSAGRVHEETKGTDDEAKPWTHVSVINGESYECGAVELFVEKGSKAEYMTLSFGATEGSDKVTYPITLSDFAPTTKPTNDPAGWRETVIVSGGRTPLAAADIYVPGE